MAILITVLTCVALSPVSLLAQGEAAVPFLEITPSPCTNGMGGAGATLPSLDAMATMANPGQLGLLSLQNTFNAATYTPKSDWLPQFRIPDLTYSATALNAGVNLATFFPLPVPVGVGIGYSRISIELGTFQITGPGSPVPIGTFHSHEQSENLSVALGIDYYLRLGVGWNFKRIESALSPIGTEQEKGSGMANISATDFGLLLVLPVTDVIAKSTGASVEITPGIKPLLDLSACYVKANEGGKVTYVDAAQSDPLPFTAKLGLAVEVGATAKAGKSDWKLFSGSLVRQAEDLLVKRFADGTSAYTSGIGEISFLDNVIQGKYSDQVLARKGWELQVGECLFLRGGSVRGMGFDYETSGYSLSLGGFFRILEFASPALAQTPWISFVGDHLDLQYNSSTYDATASPLQGTTFQSLNLVVKGLPW